MTRVLVLGGSRSGKSAFAERLLAGEAAVEYVATARSDASDAEWTARIQRHQQRRPRHWSTTETCELPAVLGAAGPAVLIDSVTTWLASAMDETGMWVGDPAAAGHLGRRVDEFVTAWARTPREVVAVSDEVGLGIVPETTSGRAFRDTLGLLNQGLAAAADEVHLVVSGLPLRLK